MEGQPTRAQPPEGVHRPSLRSTAAGLFSLAAIAATGLAAGPAAAAPSVGPCALPRTNAHHSLGLDAWNTAYPRPERGLDAVMLFLSFPDSVPVARTDEIAADYFPGTSDFFARASYGRFSLRAHVRHGWLRMPRTSTTYAIRRDWAPDRRAAYLRDALAVADPVVDFSRYDIVYMVADPDAPGVDADATKVVNLRTPLRADGTDIPRVVTLFERRPPDRNVLAHETGHVFDLPDLYNRPVDGKGDWDTHVGDWDVMGSQFAMAPEPFGWHKWKLGWLGDHQVRCVRAPQRLTLLPLAGEAGQAYGLAAVPGTRLAVVRTGRNSVLAFEARRAAGNDRGTCTEGVLIYRVRGEAESGAGPVEVVDTHPLTEACRDRSVYPPLADAPLGEGESFTVPGEGTKVEVAHRTRGGSWTLKITP
ncbi:M6 family metalloprotease domain-containing protein [Streptomyces sp. TRM49041]|uniref:M6 family metalloprotease domain-containing protein n=1 Tax=Streptomyces sp. TRM49041 TaxID=2603216 RepID=UPI0011F055FF|nr:M6 family metalloprotease domain-containing protein [Streptomyces sp. TRM49041]